MTRERLVHEVRGGSNEGKPMGGRGKKVSLTVAAHANSLWLVKSGDKVLGPFSADEVMVKLRSREIVLIDEVMSPQSRWRVLRDEPIFKAAVEEFRRGQMNSREDTEVEGYTSAHTVTLTPTTNPGTVTVTQSSGPKVVSPADDVDIPIDVGQVVDAVFVDKDDESAGPASRFNINSAPRANPSASKLKRYGVAAEAEERVQRSKAVWGVWLVALVAIAGAAFYLSRGHLAPVEERAAATGGEDQLRAAQVEWDRGDFSAALLRYKQLSLSQPGNVIVASRLATLLIRLDGQIVAAKRILREAETALNSGSASDGIDATLQKKMARLQAAFGFAALSEDDLAEADSRLQAALRADPDYFPARFNAGIVAMRNKKYSEAAKYFASAGSDPAAYLMAARALMMADKRLNFRAADLAIGKVIGSFQDFKQEALLIGASLDIEVGDRKRSAERVRSILDVDPDLTDAHWHDPELEIEWLGWRSLIPFCRKLNDDLKSSSGRALMGLCLFKAGNREEASQLLTKEMSRSPGDPMLRSVDTYMLESAGRYEDAQAILKMGVNGDSAPLLLDLVRARVCMKIADFECAENTWTKLQKYSGSNLAALIGLADLAERKGDAGRATVFAQSAKSISKNYRPAFKFFKAGEG